MATKSGSLRHCENRNTLLSSFHMEHGGIQIEHVELSRLRPWDKNPRRNDEAAKRLADLIGSHGFLNPIVASKDGVIRAGHTRYKAAQALGLKTVPVVFVEFKSDAHAHAFALADNKSAEWAEWSLDELARVLNEIESAGDVPMADTGFTADEIEKITGQLAIPGIIPDDEIPDAPTEAITKPGDIITLGRHRLMCGDSTRIDQLEMLMAGTRAHICVTSPPYNAGAIEMKGKESTKKKYNSFQDEQTEDEYTQFLTDNLTAIMVVADEVFYNVGLVEGSKRSIVQLLHTFKSSFKDVIYWKKHTAAPHIVPGVINNLVEFILCFGQEGNRKFKNAQFSQGSYWNVIEGMNASGNEFAKIHKATYPVYLPENVIANFSPPNGVVLDTFGGTGTTMIAAEKLGRSCHMMELDPIYCDLIIERWERFTDKKAVRNPDG